jgi:hypothetical protein
MWYAIQPFSFFLLLSGFETTKDDFQMPPADNFFSSSVGRWERFLFLMHVNIVTLSSDF